MPINAVNQPSEDMPHPTATHFVVDGAKPGSRGELQVVIVCFSEEEANSHLTARSGTVVVIPADQVEGEMPELGAWLLPLDRAGGRYRLSVEGPRAD